MSNPSATSNKRIESVVVLGGGSAGLLAALAIKTRLPNLKIRLYRSKAIGVIGVGEGTIPAVLEFLHVYCKISFERFILQTAPTIKLGLRFEWGKRPFFNYGYDRQIGFRHPSLAKWPGFYCWDDFTAASPASALMDAGKAFAGSGSNPVWNTQIAYHIYNPTFVEFLERECESMGVELVDAELEGIETDENGVKQLNFNGGRSASGDLYVDASGFKSLLLGGVMKAPFVDFSNTLFCDRAVVGAWERTSEPILPYTRCETMDAGWCWQIEHERYINRGYVYSSRFLSDDQAEAEMRGKNPKLKDLNLVKFRSGYYSESWVGNVVAIGNACGFVEPLESSAVFIITEESKFLANAIVDSNQTPTPTLRAFYNRIIANEWESLRGFLSIHYKFNDRLDTPFWKATRADVEVGQARTYIDFYLENGPMVVDERTLLGRNDIFGIEGHATLMLGQRVAYKNRQSVSPAEWDAWRRIQTQNRQMAQNGYDIRQWLEGMRRGNFQFVMPKSPDMPAMAR